MINSNYWQFLLQEEFKKPYFRSLMLFLESEKKNLHKVFPPESDIFKSFELCGFENLKVVIIGQDPYHGLGQAHGLAFSVNYNCPIPPSLRNIYKELINDVGITMPSHGNLDKWANQGVLLLNSTLTVRANEAGSHQKKGWEEFTDNVIKTISEHKKNVVFILWGKFAKSKSVFIDRHRHLVLESAHPSPLSVHQGFFGNQHFSKCNSYLVDKGFTAIDWQID
ncbi:MAG: uracil-DNA glycosylase [Bacteroidota bacterium]|nr:uracil-DNA glycosylase [Bacteroidota bacterium]